MNQQQSKLLEQEGTNEQEACGHPRHGGNPSYFCTSFSAIVAASTGQFKAQIMLGWLMQTLSGRPCRVQRY